MASNLGNLGNLSITIGATLKPFNAAIAHVKNTIKILNNQKISIGSVQGMTLAGAGAMGAAFAASTVAINGLIDALGRLAMAMPNAAFAANDLTMKMHQIKVAFQEASPVVTKAIDELAYKIGFSRSELTGFAADLGPMLHGMGKTEAEAAGLTKELLQLGAGASFVHDIELPQFMRLLESGVEGSTRALQRLNVFMSPFQVEMEAYRMAGRGQIAMTEEQQLAWARLSLIMKQLRAQSAQNDWAHKQLGGTFREVRGRINDLVLSFGAIIKPVFARAFMRINEILQDMGKWLGKNKQAMQDWASGLVDGIITALSSWENFKKALGKAWDWVWGGVKGAFVSAWNWITDYIVASVTYIGEVISKTITNALWGGNDAVPGGGRIAAIVEERQKARAVLAVAAGKAQGILGNLFGGGGAAAVAGAPAAGGAPAAIRKRLGLDVHDFAWAGNEFGVIPGHEAKVAADRKAMKLAKGKKGKKGAAEDEGEPTPRLPGIRPGMPRTQAAFVGLTEFAKQIQLGALGTGDDQLRMLTRIAHSTEFLAQITERRQAEKQAFAFAAGPR